jgi:uncharacterized membrane protein
MNRELSIPALIGFLLGAMGIVVLISMLLEKTVFKNQKESQKTTLSLSISAIIATITSSLLTEEFVGWYLIAGVIVFTIEKIKERGRE